MPGGKKKERKNSLAKHLLALDSIRELKVNEF